MNFTCLGCGQTLPVEQSVFDISSGIITEGWCEPCMFVESLRSAREDSVDEMIPGPIGRMAARHGVKPRTRPPKYMLDPSEYKKFGY